MVISCPKDRLQLMFKQNDTIATISCSNSRATQHSSFLMSHTISSQPQRCVSTVSQDFQEVVCQVPASQGQLENSLEDAIAPINRKCIFDPMARSMTMPVVYPDKYDNIFEDGNKLARNLEGFKSYLSHLLSVSLGSRKVLVRSAWYSQVPQCSPLQKVWSQNFYMS